MILGRDAYILCLVLEGTMIVFRTVSLLVQIRLHRKEPLEEALIFPPPLDQCPE